MPEDVETTARTALAEVLETDVTIALDAELNRLGLTSLNKVLFLMSVCERTRVGLHHFTEDDVAGMQTLGQVVTALSRYAEEA